MRRATLNVHDPELAANALLVSLEAGYSEARTAARLAGAARVAEQVAILSSDPANPYRGRPRTRGISGDFASYVYERQRATQAAQGHVKNWWQSWQAAKEAGQAQPIKAANRAQAWRVEMATSTEVADAYSVGHDAELELHSDLDLFKVWDAALDKNSCQLCELANGTVVRIDEPFPAGRPGGVHPNCRCVEQILPADLVDMSRYAA